VSQLARQLALLALSVLAGCAARSPHMGVMAPRPALPDARAQRLIAVWQEQLGRYISEEGAGDPAVLSRMPLLRSQDLVRPARITFDVLDVESYVPGRDGWDIQGVLIGKQTSGAHTWYVFLVGVVVRSGYRPTSIADIRLVALSVQGARLDWRTSPADPQAVQRYLDTFRTSVPVRFPGDTDRFSLKAAGDHVSVQELRSRAEWSLRLFGKVAHAARIHDRLVASPAPRADRPRDCELEQYCRRTAALGRAHWNL